MNQVSRKLRSAAVGRLCAVIACGCLAAWLPGCSHRVLSIFFDGVPAPAAQKEVPQQPGSATGRAISAGTFSNHGPYAARLCEACHVKQTNALVAPVNELCYKCHELQLNKKYVHGPLASGGCVVCHDPHSSPYGHLLVSESSNFCVRCHDTTDLSQNPAHQEAGDRQCTDCHDAHMSDKPYLLK